MSSLEEFKKTYSYQKPKNIKQKIEHPPKFTPGVKYSEATKSGEIVSTPQKKYEIDWKEQLQSYSLEKDYKK